MTFLDQAVNIFFSNSGGTLFMDTLFAIPIIIAIIVAIVRPFDL